ncbi:flavin reductase [Corynebacterium aurimucosum]|nr:flavin reductase [Corynebacterium aurimucosum]
MLANFFTSISLDPPLVQISFGNASTTWPALRQAPLVGISILSSLNGDEAALLRRPAQQRFDGVHLDHHDGGALLLPDAIATFLAEPYQDIPAGDHTIRLFRVLSHHRDEGLLPLHFFSDSNTTD